MNNHDCLIDSKWLTYTGLSETRTPLCPGATCAGQGSVHHCFLRSASLFLVVLVHLRTLYVLQPSCVNCSQALFKFIHLSLNRPKWIWSYSDIKKSKIQGNPGKKKQRNRNRGVFHLKLGLGPTTKLDHDRKQRLIDSGLR